MEELQELLTEELRDLYDAEKQLVKALPRMAKAATAQELKQAFLDHTEMTKGQVARIEQVFEVLGERAKSKPCKAMKGLVEEAQEHVQEHERGEMLDNMLITAAQKVEHYEIAGYGTVRSIARNLGNRQVADLLQQTLKEEEATDKLLTQVALRIQKEMVRAKPAGSEDQAASSSGGRQSAAGRGGSKKKVAASSSKQASSGGSQQTANKKAASKSASKKRPQGGAQAKTSGRNGGNAKGGSDSGAGSQVTTDHEQIRQWAEERGAKPSCVRGTGTRGDTGLLRLDFPGYSGGDSLQEVSWDEFFEKFDEQGLALLYQEETAAGEKSNFNKLISRSNAEGQGSKRRR